MALGQTMTHLSYTSRMDPLTNVELTSRRRTSILEHGTVRSPTCKVMFLGDAGAGKTSTYRQLLNEEHIDIHEPTVGVKTTISHWTHINQFWQQTTKHISELTRVLSHCLAFPESEPMLQTLGSCGDHFKTDKSKLTLVLQGLLFILFILINRWWPSPNISTFAMSLIWSTYAHSLIDNSRYRQWLVFAFRCSFGINLIGTFYFFFEQLPTVRVMEELSVGFLPAAITNDELCVQSLYALFPLIIGMFFLGFTLALGTGPAISAVLCFMTFDHHSPNGSRGNDMKRSFLSQIIILCLCSLSGVVTILILPRYQKATHVCFFAGVFIFIPTMLFASVGHQYCQLCALVFLMIAGCLVAIGFIQGQRTGQRLLMWAKIMPCFKIIEIDMFGLPLGFLYGYAINMRFVVWDNNYFILVSILGSSFVVYVRRLFYVQVQTTDLPLYDILDTLITGNNMLPAIMTLQDCAGDEIYHAAHHVFMARHACYVVVFRLTELCDNFDRTLSRIHYWINSVLAHAHYEDAKVFLVATFKMSVKSNRRSQQAIARLTRHLTPLQRTRVAHDKKERCVFVIDNKERKSSIADVELLKELLWDHSKKAKYVRLPNRVAWFAFPDFIYERRERWNCFDDAVADIDSLWTDVHHLCYLKTKTDFYRMLRFFNDCGEIFYDGDDPFLSKYVILDLDKMNDAVTMLYTNFPNDAWLANHKNESWTGVVTAHDLGIILKRNIDGPKSDILLAVLAALGLVIPIENVSFILLPHLPSREDSQILIERPMLVAVFRFTTFPPHALFLRLLAVCIHHTPVGQARLFANAAVFTFRDSVYSLLLDHVGSECRISLQVARGTSLETVLLLSRQVDQWIWHLCCRHFEFVKYKLALMCPYHFHSQVASHDFVTIVDRHQQSRKSLWNFPSEKRCYVCPVEDDAVVIPFPPMPSIGHLSNTDGARCVNEGQSAADAFISCHEIDRDFVQRRLIPVLENIPQHFHPDDAPNDSSLSILVNYMDDPCPCPEHWLPTEITQRCIEQCACVIVILSTDFLNSPRCAHELDIAWSKKKALIFVRIDCSITPSMMTDFKNDVPIDYPAHDDDAGMQWFYQKLVRSVKQCTKTYDSQRPS